MTGAQDPKVNSARKTNACWELVVEERSKSREIIHQAC